MTLTERILALAKLGVSDKAIASKLQCSWAYVRAVRSKARIKLADAEKRKALALIEGRVRK